MIAIYLYNPDMVNEITESGQVIAADSYYLISNAERENFSQDDDLLSDISSGACIVSESNSADGHVLGISDAIDLLKGSLPSRVRSVLGNEAFDISPRSMSFIAPAGLTTSFDKVINAPLAIKAGLLFAESGAKSSDTIKIELIDTLYLLKGIEYPTDIDVGGGNMVPIETIAPSGVVLAEYVPEWNVLPAPLINKLVSQNVGKLPVADLVMRLHYTSTADVGSPDVVGNLNIIAYRVS